MDVNVDAYFSQITDLYWDYFLEWMAGRVDLQNWPTRDLAAPEEDC